MKPIPIALALFGLASQGFAALTIAISPSLGPNPTSSPSFDGYSVNAISGLLSGQNQIGGSSATVPTAFEVTDTFTMPAIAATVFNSWNGVAGPLAAPRDQERGGAMYLGVRITDPVATFEPWNLALRLNSSDPRFDESGLGFDQTLLFGDLDEFSSTRIGVVYPTLDNPIPQIITSGPMAGVMVNEFVFLGAAYSLNDDGPAFSDPAVLDELRLTEPFGVTATYTLYDYDDVEDDFIVRGEASANVSIIPEPSTALLSALALGGLALRRRRI